jgi:hypothetical protein
MKTLKFLPILGCIWMLTMASTCSSDDDNTPVVPVQNTNIPLVNATVQQGNWRITYFYDTDHDETSSFNNYTFTFGSGGVLTATGNSNTYTGTWSVTNSHNGNDDSQHSSNDTDFNLAFSSPANFTELNDDWDIVSYTSARIELIDVSGGNGGTDHLVFEKN